MSSYHSSASSNNSNFVGESGQNWSPAVGLRPNSPGLSTLQPKSPPLIQGAQVQHSINLLSAATASSPNRKQNTESIGQTQCLPGSTAGSTSNCNNVHPSVTTSSNGPSNYAANLVKSLSPEFSVLGTVTRKLGFSKQRSLTVDVPRATPPASLTAQLTQHKGGPVSVLKHQSADVITGSFPLSAKNAAADQKKFLRSDSHEYNPNDASNALKGVGNVADGAVYYSYHHC